MKIANLRSNLFLLLLLVFVAGCKEDEITPDVVDSNNPNAEVNNWVYDEMTNWYLWADKLAVKATTANELAPNEYFSSLLYLPGDTDRFSWIQESAEELRNSLNGKNTSLGIRTSPFYTDDAKKNVAFSIAYVLKGSPAERAGLKRGDFITKVGGNDITLDTYSSALSPENLSLTLGDYVNGNIVSNTTVINVTKEEVQTNPIQHHSVITEGNKKIGYLVYTQYLSQYDDEMRKVFGEFKAAGVTELVLDLRYNGGGYISSATTLSSLIGRGVSSSQVCYRDEWNANITKQFQDRFGEDYFTKSFRDEANNIGASLSRVFVLTSRGTASASELTMNNLLPYMEVIQIGDNTYGKNVGSITIDDDKNRWKWGMQPIVLRTVNKNGNSDYGSKEGFAPKVRVSDNRLPFQAFGDKRETLLSAAIEYINGGPTLATAANARIRPSERVSPLSVTDNPRENRFEMYAEPLPKK
ncbi:MAG: C-terminal processing protease CtpA/Prc [Spirosomataceae bacterium]|jgi:carboxyl-terminal processing protease